MEKVGKHSLKRLKQAIKLVLIAVALTVVIIVAMGIVVFVKDQDFDKDKVIRIAAQAAVGIILVLLILSALMRLLKRYANAQAAEEFNKTLKDSFDYLEKEKDPIFNKLHEPQNDAVDAPSIAGEPSDTEAAMLAEATIPTEPQEAAVNDDDSDINNI